MSDAALNQQLPQLRMEIRGVAERFAGGGIPTPPPGYGVRPFRPGDEDDWLDLLLTGEFGAWTRTRLDLMLGHPHVRVPRNGIFFATVADRPVGSASTYLHPIDDGRIDPELGWVIVAPEHRGHGLGLLVCQAVLQFMGRLGYDHAYLLTDDFRLPAIRTYLKLGFEPALVDPSHPERWAVIHRQLALIPRPPPLRGANIGCADVPRAGEGAGGHGE